MTNISDVQLYVLVTESVAKRPTRDVVRMAIDGGADAIQLREKEMPDDRFLHLAEELRSICREAGVLLIVNDRVAISRLAGADGVHVGQDDLPAPEARKILRPDKILGVSTHSIEQARQAVAQSADYIGVGPVYPTETKGYEEGVGLDLVRQAAAEIDIPFFAIGGIALERLDEVIAAGCTRVAVSSAVIAAEDVTAAAKQFKAKLAAAAG